MGLKWYFYLQPTTMFTTTFNSGRLEQIECQVNEGLYISTRPKNNDGWVVMFYPKTTNPEDDEDGIHLGGHFRDDSSAEYHVKQYISALILFDNNQDKVNALYGFQRNTEFINRIP